MSRGDNVRSLEDMLDHAREAVAMLENASADSLEHDRQLHLSLQRLLEIIGEAANRVSTTKQEQHPEIPWAEIIAMRNRVIHGYDWEQPRRPAYNRVCGRAPVRAGSHTSKYMRC